MCSRYFVYLSTVNADECGGITGNASDTAPQGTSKTRHTQPFSAFSLLNPYYCETCAHIGRCPRHPAEHLFSSKHQLSGGLTKLSLPCYHSATASEQRTPPTRKRARMGAAPRVVFGNSIACSPVQEITCTRLRRIDGYCAPIVLGESELCLLHDEKRREW